MSFLSAKSTYFPQRAYVWFSDRWFLYGHFSTGYNEAEDVLLPYLCNGIHAQTVKISYNASSAFCKLKLQYLTLPMLLTKLQMIVAIGKMLRGIFGLIGNKGAY